MNHDMGYLEENQSIWTITHHKIAIFEGGKSIVFDIEKVMKDEHDINNEEIKNI